MGKTRLKDYLIKGYAVIEKRLAQKEQEVQILKNGIQILRRAVEKKQLIMSGLLFSPKD